MKLVSFIYQGEAFYVNPQYVASDSEDFAVVNGYSENEYPFTPNEASSYIAFYARYF